MSVLTIAGYALLLVAGIALQVLARRPGSRLRPIQAYASAVMRTRTGRWIMLVLWWWVGWHFFVR
jgi:hypothetical protein